MLWLHEASDSCNNPVSLGVQVSIRRKFDGLKHGGRLVLHNLLQLDTQAQMLTACASLEGFIAQRVQQSSLQMGS